MPALAFIATTWPRLVRVLTFLLLSDIYDCNSIGLHLCRLKRSGALAVIVEADRSCTALCSRVSQRVTLLHPTCSAFDTILSKKALLPEADGGEKSNKIKYRHPVEVWGVI